MRSKGAKNEIFSIPIYLVGGSLIKLERISSQGGEEGA